MPILGAPKLTNEHGDAENVLNGRQVDAQHHAEIGLNHSGWTTPQLPKVVLTL